MYKEAMQIVKEIYTAFADDDEMWKSLAVMLRKFVDALVEEGFTREEALDIVTKMPNIAQPKLG